MKIHADRDVCIGSGNCVLTDDEIFDQDDDGVVLVLRPRPDAAHHDKVREAVARCPSRALSIVDG